MVSKFQSATKERLLLLLGEYEVKENYRPSWLVNPKTGRRLEIDLYYPLLNIGIEVQGEQHTQFVPVFHENEQAFEDQKERDDFKRAICQKNGLKLYEVYRLDDVDLFIDELRDHCKEVSEVLSKKNNAIKELAYFAALLAEAVRRTDKPEARDKLLRKMVNICECHKIPFSLVKPDFTLTKMDIYFAKKPKVRIHRVRDYGVSKKYWICPLIKIEDGKAFVVEIGEKGQYFEYTFDLSTGDEMNPKVIVHKLDLSSLPGSVSH